MWIEALKASSGPAVAIVAAYIAYQQFHLARNKLRLDLYEKRFKVYMALKKFILSVVREANAQNEDYFTLHAEIAEADFLFGPEIVRYIAEVKSKVTQLRVLNDKLHHQNLPIGDERNKAAAEDAAILGWVSRQLDEAPAVFKPYLDFRMIRG